MITTLGIPRRGAQLLTAVCAAVVLAGCGAGGSDSPDAVEESAEASTSPAASTSPSPSPSQTEAAPAWANCSDIWVDGNRLPKKYRGCLDGDTAVAADPRQCSMGGRLVTYGDRFYAIIGGPVNEVSSPLAKDPAFRTAQAQCGA